MATWLEVALAGTVHWPSPLEPQQVAPPDADRVQVWAQPPAMATWLEVALAGTVHWPKSYPWQPQQVAPPVDRVQVWEKLATSVFLPANRTSLHTLRAMARGCDGVAVGDGIAVGVAVLEKVACGCDGVAGGVAVLE